MRQTDKPLYTRVNVYITRETDVLSSLRV